LFQFYLKDVISGRDQALAQLSSQLGQLADQLALERRSAADLRTQVSSLTDELGQSTTLRNRLEQELATAAGQAGQFQTELENAFKTISADRETIEVQLRELDALRRNVESLTALRKDLEDKLTVQTSATDAQKKLSEDAQAQADALRRQIATLQNSIA